jgi:hypothetical protein
VLLKQTNIKSGRRQASAAAGLKGLCTQNWKLEWSMVPEERLPPRFLEVAEKIGIRTLVVTEEYGGCELEKGTEVKSRAFGATAQNMQNYAQGGRTLMKVAQHAGPE